MTQALQETVDAQQKKNKNHVIAKDGSVLDQLCVEDSLFGSKCIVSSEVDKAKALWSAAYTEFAKSTILDGNSSDAALEESISASEASRCAMGKLITLILQSPQV